MKIKLFLVFCFALQSVYSQSFSSHAIALTPTAIPESNFDKKLYEEKLHKKFSTEKPSADLDRYIQSDAISKEYFFSSNQIYTNWPEATNYVKKVFNAGIPSEFNKNEVKIYIVREAEVNAFCMEDGNIAVTVGFLAYMSNEAQLAGVLGHEFGHYYSNHIYNDYKKINHNKVLKALVRSQSLLGGLIIAQDQSEFRQDQERQADTFAYNFFNKNGYSPESMAETFKGFQNITNKYKKLQRYRRPLIYFKTHPSNEERIKNAQTAFKNKNITGKRFQVDSLEFAAIKKRATDETIYLLFEELRYEECLEMAYLQYLYHPNDEFYLFFITECLRRQTVFEEGFAEEFFITGNYKNLTQPFMDPSKVPAHLKGKYSKKLNSRNYAKSVFTNMNNEIFNLTDADLAAVQAKELVTNDTLEFLFNEDALDYFSKKIPDSSCIFNIRRVSLNQPLAAGCEEKPGMTDLEKDYTRVITDYNILKEVVHAYKKAPVILLNIRTYSGTGQLIHDPVLSDELYESYEKVVAANPDQILDTKNKFNFREYQKIKNASGFIGLLEMNRFFGKTEHNCDFINVFPELTSEINTYGYRKLIFIELTALNVSSSENITFRPTMGGERWAAAIYVVDLVKKKIYVKTTSSSMFDLSRNRENKIKNILNECALIAQE
ncbi:MAG: M48 family metalloprotease [Bacteroidetes bacterium]|nr:M48 family metalloprotease [Bacteroidota bacterium]